MPDTFSAFPAADYNLPGLTGSDAPRASWAPLKPRRFFIITPGRSGSSLLAAILEACGAPFGPDCAGDSDTERDHWESRTIDRAIRCAERANDHFAPGMAGPGRVAYRFWRSRAKALLKSGLRNATYSKNRWNTVILPLAELLGYRPAIIVSYRHPAEVAMSDMRKMKNVPSVLLPAISRTYSDATYAIRRYGGVVIDHAELVDPDAVDWAMALQEVTGIPAGMLCSARRKLLKPEPPTLDNTALWLPSELRAVSQTLSSLRNKPLADTRADRSQA